ncbi:MULTISPECIES: hypothetical protein [Actinomycetes]|uniref:hypothetical protein n=1 Tax=Actinomycetes TaxID=1760 RepID=UPI0035CBCC6A
MDGVSTVVAVLAAVVIVLALLFYVVTLVWAGRNRLGTAGTAPGGTGPRPPDGPSESLARGFSYLHVSPRSSARRAGVQQRLERAYRRVDAVDPYAAPRRIGEALLQAGLTEPPPSTRPEDRR